MSAAGIFGPLLGDAEVAAILGDGAGARAMVAVEVALAKVEGRLGVIDAAAAARSRRPSPDSRRTSRISPAAPPPAGVPVPALVAQLRRQVGGEAAAFVHWGATSQDIVDTALVLQLREALALLERRLDELIAALARLADAHRATPMIGRTRFQQAVPTTFGLKVAGWLAPLLRHRERLRRAEAAAARGPARRRRRQPGRPRRAWDRGHEGAGRRARARLSGHALAQPARRARRARLLAARWSPARWASSGRTCCCSRRTRSARCARRRAAARRPCRRSRTRSGPRRWSRWRAATRRCSAGCTRPWLHAHERDGAAWQLEWLILPDMVLVPPLRWPMRGRCCGP